MSSSLSTSDRFATGLAQFVVRWRWWVILAAVVTAGAVGSGAQNLEFANNYRVFFSDENPELVAFEDLQATYTKNDNFLFVIEPADGKVFSADTLSAVEALTSEAWKIPYAIRVDSITNFQHTYGVDDDLVVEDLYKDVQSMSAADIDRRGDINEWHTCPQSGRIDASNPCSEYMFLDDTACNLASLNLLTFLGSDGQFDIPAYRHAIRLWTLTLEIAVLMAQFPSQAIAERSYEFRTLGLGYANLGGLLMACGLPYDSAAGRSMAAALTAILTGDAYAASAEMAGELGPFPGYAENREEMLRVMRNHRRAAHGETEDYEGLSQLPVALDGEHCPDAGPGGGRLRVLGRGPGAGRDAGLPQRPDQRSSPRRAPSAWSWTATRQASSRTSPWSSSRSWPAAATSRSSTVRSRPPWRGSATPSTRSRPSSATRSATAP